MGLIGTIVRTDGALCVKLENSPAYYPCRGNSHFAMKLGDTLGREADASDIGRRVYNVRGVLTLETDEDRAARQAIWNARLDPCAGPSDAIGSRARAILTD